MKDLSLKLIKQNNEVIMTQIILASASPRRKELLSKITTNFEIIPSNAVEIYPENLDENKKCPLFMHVQSSAWMKQNLSEHILEFKDIVTNEYILAIV
jgi:predicted house-cleaning NTP pyrophosphatase (Maf/HAM1 superfamily)